MVTIRLARHGAKKSPFYHITVADRSASRDGRFIERVGFYNPVAQGQAEVLRVDLERVDHWISTGAQPSEIVGKLVKKARKAASAGTAAAATVEAPAAADAE
ncbi:MAG: 30S ribosomal protein S16 [Pseudomonadales bacterium]|nr:30S ribosomal protein S16 [Pseudomonadales bacterium]